jgi:hypothetical protein
MSTLTVEHGTTIQEQIFNLLSISTWEECKQGVKALYQQIRNTLTDEEQSELLLDIFINSLIDDDITEYFNYMEK